MVHLAKKKKKENHRIDRRLHDRRRHASRVVVCDRFAHLPFPVYHRSPNTPCTQPLTHLRKCRPRRSQRTPITAKKPTRMRPVFSALSGLWSNQPKKKKQQTERLCGHESRPPLRVYAAAAVHAKKEWGWLTQQLHHDSRARAWHDQPWDHRVQKTKEKNDPWTKGRKRHPRPFRRDSRHDTSALGGSRTAVAFVADA